uniref:PHD-type domain-containing protein n=1 Tax=Iconisemion striatum TaxID=60296 RepID=A0A1A7WGC0_9TELE
MGGVSEGDDVLARWSDGLLYLGNVKRVDGVKQCCLVRFEDNSEFWVLRKDIHSFSAGVEEVCCICDAPPLKEPLVNCLKCRHGYHPECHTPTIELEADSDSWICRQCVFAVATKRGGALKRGRFARLMQFMKLRLPYQLSSLDWDPQHLTNQQQCYCYCAGPGEWNLKMLQCGSCGQWFHEACTQCLMKPLLYGDRFYQFQCSVCTKGPETILRLPMTWVDLAHLVLYHLSLCCKRKYFDFDHEILSFTNENWDSLLLGALSDTPRQDRCHNLLGALNSNKDRFVSGKEIKKKKCLFGLQVRAPPPLTSDSSPLITDPPISITHRRSPLSLPCQRRVGGPESRKSKRRIMETQKRLGVMLCGDRLQDDVFTFNESTAASSLTHRAVDSLQKTQKNTKTELDTRANTKVTVLEGLMMLAQTPADPCVSPLPRPVHPRLLPTLLSCCHVAMATWEEPTFTTPGSRRRSLTCALLPNECMPSTTALTMETLLRFPGIFITTTARRTPADLHQHASRIPLTPVATTTTTTISTSTTTATNTNTTTSTSRARSSWSPLSCVTSLPIKPAWAEGELLEQEAELGWGWEGVMGL